MHFLRLEREEEAGNNKKMDRLWQTSGRRHRQIAAAPAERAQRELEKIEPPSPLVMPALRAASRQGAAPL